MSVSCECCVLSGRGLCDELITRPEESYRLWCVVLCDLETSWMRRPWPTGGEGLLRPPKRKNALIWNKNKLLTARMYRVESFKIEVFMSGQWGLLGWKSSEIYSVCWCRLRHSKAPCRAVGWPTCSPARWCQALSGRFCPYVFSPNTSEHCLTVVSDSRLMRRTRADWCWVSEPTERWIQPLFLKPSAT